MIQVTIKPSNKKEVLDIIKDSLKREKSMFEIAINQTVEILENFEKKYRMETKTFYKKFCDGKIGDKTDFIEWAGEKEILDRLKKQYNEIKEIQFAY